MSATKITGRMDYASPDVALEGAHLSAVHKGDTIDGNDAVYLTTDRGVFRLHHVQDCCECVVVESLTGWSGNGGVVRVAEERTDGGENDERGESWLATFYTIRTDGDDIDLRWFGESNGYYSESVTVDLVAAVPPDAVLVIGDLVGGAA